MSFSKFPVIFVGMKHFVILFILVLSPLLAQAQSELPGDTISGLPSRYRSYDGFLLDMSLFDRRPTTMPSLDFSNPYTALRPLTGSTAPAPLFNLTPSKPKSGWTLRTFSTHGLDGWHAPGGGAAPWSRNFYHGMYEWRSPNGKFSFRVETRQYK
jgi:hypothetical protein